MGRKTSVEGNSFPHRKLKELGVKSLRNYELLSLVLGKSRKTDILALSYRIMDQYRCWNALEEADLPKVMELFGISEQHAIKLLALFELGRRLFNKSNGVYIRSPREAYEYLKPMGFFKKEHLRGLYLDARNKVIRDEIIAIGTLTSSLIHPREVLRPAIEVGAVGIILAHNHPSGDPSPSREDIEATNNIVKASRIMNIELLDHIIIGNSSYASLREKGIV